MPHEWVGSGVQSGFWVQVWNEISGKFPGYSPYSQFLDENDVYRKCALNRLVPIMLA